MRQERHPSDVEQDLEKDLAFRLSINARKIEGPYGGGNQFANTLENYLRRAGHEVFRDLAPGLDAILIVSSQRELRITAYSVDDIHDYTSLNPNTVVVQRVNSCDEPRGSNLGINQALLKANQAADHTVFVSYFVRDLLAPMGLDARRPNCLILNGADEETFNSAGRAEWTCGQKIRIVTHHWSSNYLKGFDIYERLDQLLEREPFRELFEFTYIGNIAIGVSFHNVEVIGPTCGATLADRLRQHHVYLTAARNEPGPNHCVEGMRCGLPILYLKSGGLSEYCAPYGIGFTLVDFEEKVLEMHKRYAELREKVLECPYTGTWMGSQYEGLFRGLIAERRAKPRPHPGLAKAVELYLFRRPYRRIQRLRELWKKAVGYLA